MARVRESLLTMVGWACVGGCWQQAAVHCDPSPEVEGQQAIAEAYGTRHDEILFLEFQLASDAGGRFTTAPAVETDLGGVTDVEADADRARVEVRLGAAGTVTGTVRLAGTIRAEFRDDVDRCPFERSFTVRVSDATVTIR